MYGYLNDLVYYLYLFIFRRKSSTRNLHQKLVVSKNNIRKATRLDMDDRAKMLQYFNRFLIDD